MPVDTCGQTDLDLDAVMVADTVAIGVEAGDSVVLALEGMDGGWVAYRATVGDARAMAFALLEKVAIVERESRCVSV